MYKRAITTLIIIAILASYGVAPIVRAEEDQHTVTQVVTASPDTTPPSVPLNLTATAVSTSQINLSWSASTDDTAVTGYRIYRDSVIIATTTSLTYSDTGLTAATTYTYTVSAIDGAYNDSGQSASASATTFSVTTNTGSTGTTGNPGDQTLQLLSFQVIPDYENAVIQFTTNLAATSIVYWGETSDYELGSLNGLLFLTEHNIRIEGLRPGTLYHFKIELQDGYGRHRTLGDQTFTTLTPANINLPQNVSDLIATPTEKDITLTWKNPRTNFDSVRILKSTKFFPRDPYDGEVVYEGNDQIYIDRDVVKDTTYYYTVFTKSPLGDFSSGALTSALLLKPGQKPPKSDLFGGILELSRELINPMIRDLTLLDVDFIQDGKKLPVVSDTVGIRGDRDLIISIDYNKVPELLKTIAVTMHDPEDPEQTFSFLLRVNKEKTAYEAHIAPLKRAGNYKFGIAILDHKNQGLKKMAGVIVATVPELFFQGGTNIFDTFAQNPEYSLLLLLVLAALLILGILVSRKKKKVPPTQPQTQI